MKAKRIAEIAHKMSQLNKEMEALSADLKDEHGPAGTAQLIARAIIENTLKAIPPAANNDQLRTELGKLLARARSSVDYQMSSQNQNHEAGRKHYAHFQSLLGEIDAAIAAYRKQGGDV